MATINAEIGLISAILKNPDSGKIIIEQGITEDFFHSRDKTAGTWILRYIDKWKKAPDRITFKKQFPEFRIYNVTDLDYYINEIKQAHGKTKLVSGLADAADAISIGDLEGAIKIMQTRAIEAANITNAVNDTDIIDDWASIYEEAEKRRLKYEETGSAGIPTGFDTVDKFTGGAQPGQLWIVGARMGNGKSWSLMKMAVNAVISGKVVQFNALEMTRSEVGYRIHGLLSKSVGRTAFSNIALAQGTEVDLEKYRRFLASLRKNVAKEAKLHVSDATKKRLSTTDLQAQIERNEPDIVYIDYLTLMEMRGEGDWMSIGHLINSLKQMTIHYEIPIICAAQMKRSDNSVRGVGGIEDIAGADRIGQEADVVLLQHLHTRRAFEGLCAKNRHGPGDFAYYAHYEPEKGIFNEINLDDMRLTIDQDLAADNSSSNGLSSRKRRFNV